jgi:hypothetical protein
VRVGVGGSVWRQSLAGSGDVQPDETADDTQEASIDPDRCGWIRF